MTMLASKLGIRLILRLGSKATKPASADVMSALQKVEVTNDMDREDGFRLVFAVCKDKRGEFGLVRSGAVDPDTRVVIGVLIGATLHPLVDGVIYHQQLEPAQDPGTFTLTVMGRSIQVMLDLEKKTPPPYANLATSAIVKNILSNYQTLGITDLTGVTTTSDAQSEKDLTRNGKGTDLAYIRELARQKGVIFYLEPKTLGTTAVYWGPASGSTAATLPALCVNLGSATNVTDLHFGQDALAPINVTGTTIDPSTKTSKTIPAPTPSPSDPKTQPISARRTELLRTAARLGLAEAQDAAAALVAKAPDPIKTTGTLDTVSYGDVLRARRMVTVRGAGCSYDGDYLIRQVTHEIEVGKYTQRFTLSRKGLQASP
jgi:phage protein D